MKLKDTKVGAFLKDKAPKVLDVVGDLLPNNGTLGIVKNIISSGSGSQEEKDKMLAELADLEKEYLKDVQNARDNETARDNNPNSSFLSKNIHEMIAIGVVLGWISSWYFKPFIEYGEITGVVTLILGYLYGRTKPQ